LPERQILDAVGDDEKTIKELGKKFGAEIVRIGSVWLGKNNLAAISRGKIKLTEKGKEFLKEKMPQEEVLELVSKNKKVPKDMKDELKKLKKRGKILKVAERKKWSYEIIDIGKKLKEKDLKLVEEVSLVAFLVYVLMDFLAKLDSGKRCYGDPEGDCHKHRHDVANRL